MLAYRKYIRMDIFVMLLLISLFSSLLAYNVFVWFFMLLQAYFAAYIGTRKVISDLNGSLEIGRAHV